MARTEGAEIGLVESFTQALVRGIKWVRGMFDADIATPGNMKTIEEIAKLAGRCLRMELDKRPEMLEVAVHLRKLRKAIHQGEERLFLFSWGMKSKSEAPANLTPIGESSGSSKLVRIEAPTETTPSQGSKSSTQKVGIVASTEAVPAREISNNSQNESIVDPTETSPSHESNSNTRNERLVAIPKAVFSQGSNGSASNVKFIVPTEAASSQKGSSSSSKNVRIVAPTETTSKESIGNNQIVGIVSPRAFQGFVAPTEAASSEENSSTTQKVGIVSVGPMETTLQLELKDLYQAPVHILGSGIFGLTYSLKCLNGPELVVKQRTRDMQGSILTEVKFKERVASIGAIQSKHIVPLRGYYYSNEKVLLLYDNMSMGSLARALHGGRGSCQAPLDWVQRSAISLAVAGGVAFIHSLRPSSFHGNIKSSNVLLSSTHEACLSEHGVSTLLTDVCRPSPSQKTDVYRFGVLLLELLTRKAPAYDFKGEADLPQWVLSVAQKNWAVEVLDVELQGKRYKGREEECMMRLLRLALNCCSKDANFVMPEVVQRIEVIRSSWLSRHIFHVY